MIIKRMIEFAWLVMTVAMAGLVWGGQESHDQGALADAVTGAVIGAVAEELFDTSDRAILANYLGGTPVHGAGKNKAKSLPPGLRKKLEREGELPPGWRAKVARGEVIDYDLYNHARSLPENVLGLLRQGPMGTSVRQIDDRIVRIADASRIILDVFYAEQGVAEP